MAEIRNYTPYFSNKPEIELRIRLFKQDDEGKLFAIFSPEEIGLAQARSGDDFTKAIRRSIEKLTKSLPDTLE